MNNYNIYDTPQQLYASPYNQHMMITSPMVPLVTLQPHNQVQQSPQGFLISPHQNMYYKYNNEIDTNIIGEKKYQL